MGQFSNIMGYSGRYFTNKGFLGGGQDLVEETIYTVIVDNHPRLHNLLLTRNAKKGWLHEQFDEEDMPFVNALRQAIDEDAGDAR